MITIISSTNRKNSNTQKIAQEVMLHLSEMTNEPVQILDLSEIDYSKLNKPSYQTNSEYGNSIRGDYFQRVHKILFIIPEYNGSYPGILKYFIDLISTSSLRQTFYGKKAGIIGIAQGMAGNVRGTTHFSAVLMHLGVQVIPKQLHISQVESQIDRENKLIEPSKKYLIKQLHAFIQF